MRFLLLLLVAQSALILALPSPHTDVDTASDFLPSEKLKNVSSGLSDGLGEVSLSAEDGQSESLERYMALRYADKLITNVDQVVAPVALAMTIWGLTRDCREFDDEGEPAIGFSCVMTAVIAFIGVAMAIRDGSLFYMNQADRIFVKVIDAGVRYAGQKLASVIVGGMPVYMGPFNFGERHGIDNSQIEGGGNTKRDLQAREDRIAHTEKTLSLKLGHEVRHIGTWDGLLPGESVKRDGEGQEHPVYAMERDGQHFHMAVTPDPESVEEKRLRIRMGKGPGVKSDLNTRRLQRRDVYEPEFEVEELEFNKVYFDKGGLEGNFENEYHEDHEGYVDVVDTDLNWLDQQVRCSLGAQMSDEEDDVVGMWFSILDDEHRQTMSHGVLAAFYPGYEHIISQLTIEPHMSSIEECAWDPDWLKA